jgi:hypothetical protein
LNEGDVQKLTNTVCPTPTGLGLKLRYGVNFRSVCAAVCNVKTLEANINNAMLIANVFFQLLLLFIPFSPIWLSKVVYSISPIYNRCF